MKTKTLCTYLGGSQLYHLETPESDLDERGVFMHTDPAYILGTKRFDEERKQNKDTDKVMKELSHFCSLLRRSNSEAMETLFADDDAFDTLSPEFERLREERFSFVDSKGLFNCLRGYMKGELRLACGERKGKLGGKRYTKLQEVGFSPKNFVQLFRLGHVGCHFFNENRYVVDTRQFNGNLHQFMYDVKTQPELYSVEELTTMAHDLDKKLAEAFENRKVDHKFNETKLNELLLEVYLPVLQK